MQLPFPDEAAGAEPQMTPDALARLFEIPFTDEQLDAITAAHDPAVVIAGAGSGKTTLMSARVVWLVANGSVAADAVLGLTFTNKAAVELSSRVRAALRRLQNQPGYEEVLDDGEPTVSTYHAYAGSLVREYGVWGGFEPGAQLLTEAQRFQLAELVVRRASGPFPALGVKLKAVTERVVELEGEVNEHLVDLDDVVAHDEALIAELDAVETHDGKLNADPAKARDTARARLELVGLVREYRAEKLRRERVDFGDQMAAAAVLAETIEQSRRGERGRFSTVLLDEYQDTSMAQQRLLVALYGDGYPVMAVGDPFQSIYGWRGASIRNILSFRDDFAGQKPAPVFALGQNNRSGGAILTAANLLAEPLREEFPDVVELRPRADLADVGDVTVGIYRTVDDEIEAVCDAIADEVTQGRPAQDIAVLCRESKTFPAVIAGLTNRKVPVDVVGLSGLLEVPEVVEVISMLEVLHDPAANPHLVRILAGPRWRIGPVDLALLGTRARQLAASSEGDDAEQQTRLSEELQRAVAGSDPSEVISLSEALDSPGVVAFSSEARARFRRLTTELHSLRGVLEQPPDAAIAAVITAIGLDVELAVEGRPRDHLDALIEQARLFAASGGTSVGPFLSYVHLAQKYGDTLGMAAPTGGSGVSLLTVHRSKGLEWPSVYVPGVVEGVFPNTRSRSTPYTAAAVLPYSLRGDASDFPTVKTWSGNQGLQEFKRKVAERELAEDRRLAYVAVTRAAHRLVVTGHRWGSSQQKPRKESVYLRSLHDLCVAGGGTVVNWHPEPEDGESNPMLQAGAAYAWPVTGDPQAAAAREQAAALVRQWQARHESDAGSASQANSEALTVAEAEIAARWDDDIKALLAEAARPVSQDDQAPPLLSATSAVQVLRDPESTMRRLRRPLPASPANAARRGTRFHQWVETRFGQVPLLDLDGWQVGDDQADEDELEVLKQAFLAGPFAERQPLAIEAPFQLVLGQATVVGRIDAVYEVEGDPSLPEGTRYDVVDWKTGQHPADQLQLALYRLAWAELHGIPVELVAATFYYVATGELERPIDLPDRDGLTQWWSRVAGQMTGQGTA